MDPKKLFSGVTSRYLAKTYFVYGFISLAILLIKILIARLYGQENLGVYTYFFGLVSLAFLFTSFGLPEALTQTLAKDKRYLKSGLKHFLVFIIPFTFVFIVIFILVTNYLNLNPEIRLFNLAFILYIVCYSLFYLTYSILRGYKQFVIGSFFSLCERIFFIIFLILLFFISSSFTWVLIVMSLALLLASFISLPRIIKKSDKEQIIIPKKTFFSIAIALFLTQISFYSLRYIDILTIQYLLNLMDLGLYSAYASVTNIIRLIAYVFPVVVLPMAVTSKFKLRLAFKKILFLLVPFSVIVLILTYFVVPLFYGVEYKTTCLPIYLVISSFLLVLYSYFNSVFVGENKFSKFYINLLVIDVCLSLILNTILNLYFISKLGLIGAPIATSIVIILKIILNIYGIKRLRK